MTPQELKNSVLQLAIQGKLVEQHPKEGTAYNLLSSVEVFDAVDGQRVKQKYVTEITEEEKSFEIPESWAWIKLGNVCTIARGGSPRPIKEYITDAPDGVNWIKIGDTEKNGKYISSTAEKIKPSGVSKSRMVHVGDFLLTNSMSFGRPYILKTDGCIHDGWLVISQGTEVFNQDFLYWMLSSGYAFSQFCGKVSGAVVKNLNSEKVANSVFPLPPLAEQKRIVDKIEELLPLVDRYEEAYNKLEELNKSFPLDMQNSILQMAIQGKLVPQDLAEGTGEKLYKQIQDEKQILVNAGKIKKEKPLPEITDDDIPFDIPDNWKWCKLGSLTYNWGQKTPTEKFCYIDVGSIDNRVHKLNSNNTILQAEDASSRARKIVHFGDVIFATIRPYLQNISIIDRDFPYEPIVSTAFAVMHCPEGLDNKYLYYYLQSPSFMSYVNATDKSKGVAYPAIGEKDFFNGLLPLPPHGEQKRIVAKMEELLPLCEKLGF